MINLLFSIFLNFFLKLFIDFACFLSFLLISLIKALNPEMFLLGPWFIVPFSFAKNICNTLNHLLFFVGLHCVECGLKVLLGVLSHSLNHIILILFNLIQRHFGSYHFPYFLIVTLGKLLLNNLLNILQKRHIVHARRNESII